MLTILPGDIARPTFFGDNIQRGWETREQVAGAWIEIKFPEVRRVSELWILPQPLPFDVVGRDPYMMTYSRLKLLEAPRRVRCLFAGGMSMTHELPQTTNYQIIALPRTVETDFVRIAVEERVAETRGQGDRAFQSACFPATA